MTKEEQRDIMRNIKIELLVPHEMNGRTLEIILDTRKILKRIAREMTHEEDRARGVKIGEIHSGDLIKIRFVY